MLTYNFCVLSIGLEYYQYAAKLIASIKEFTDFSTIVVATDNFDAFKDFLGEDYDPERIKIFQIDEIAKKKFSGRFFNYNLKVYSLLFDSQSSDNAQYAIYLDSDVFFHRDARATIQKTLGNMDDLQVICGRPALFRALKAEERPFCRVDKLVLYGLYDTDRYDETHCVNEQFLFFRRKTPQYDAFIARWLELESKCRAAEVFTFAEGIEIGMCLVDAGLSPKFIRHFDDTMTIYSNKNGLCFTY